MNDIVSSPQAQHEMYVALGYCPAIHVSRVWCCQREGHDDKHFALRVLSSTQFVRAVEWD